MGSRIGGIIGLLALTLLSMVSVALSFKGASCPAAYRPLEPPSIIHPLGTDPLGRDALCELLLGVRSSLEAVLGALTSSLVVLGLSLLSGVFGKARRITGAFAALTAGLPRISLLMLLALTVRLTAFEIGLIVGLIVSIQGAQAVSSRARQIANTLYVAAARAVGAPWYRIIIKHVAPHAWNSIAAYASIAASAAVYAEAGLSMIGLGSPSTPSLGRVASLILLTPGAMLTAAGLAQIISSLILVAIVAASIHVVLTSPRGIDGR